MLQTRASRIEVLCIISVFIAVILIFHTPAVLAQAPSFLPVVTYDPGGYQASSVAIADVNGDGKLDVIVTNCGGCYGPSFIHYGANSVGVLLGNGDGTLQPAVTYDSGGQVATLVVVADVNSDHKLDLVVLNRNSNDIGVLLGNGNGTFQPARTFAAGGLISPSSVAVGDVNGDGKLDLIVANLCADNNCDGSVGVLLGNGDGTFQSVVTYPAGIYTDGVAVADVNGDGKQDVLALTSTVVCTGQACARPGAVAVLLGNGDATFQPAVMYLSGGNVDPPFSSLLVVADVNGDGKPDLLVESSDCCDSVNGVPGVLLGNGDGTFQPVMTYKLEGGGSGSAIVVADVNGDGEPDLISSDHCGAGANCFYEGLVAIRLGNGDGTFHPARTYSSGGFLTNSVAAGDLNGDGKPDLVVANICADDATYCQSASIGVLLNNTQASCVTPPSVTLSSTATFLWPPNGRMVPVTVSGKITDPDASCSIKAAAYAVTDEYGKVQPSGPLTLGAGGLYSFTVPLQASRLGSDIDGRHYTITVGATNNAGKTGSQSATVIVPHDLGH